MTNKPFFSVIVPEHNAAKWMRKGLSSIRNQTFKDYELIIICDSCEDDTAKIALNYADKLYTVRYQSCGKSRNQGLYAAKGEWILFMDDDDWWADKKAFKKIHDEIVKDDDFDVLAFGFVFGDRGDTFQHEGRRYPAIWNKAWKREFIERIGARFPEVPHSDDVGFAEATHGKARFRYLHEVLYYYNYMRVGSITQKLATGELKTLEEMGLR